MVNKMMQVVFAVRLAIQATYVGAVLRSDLLSAVANNAAKEDFPPKKRVMSITSLSDSALAHGAFASSLVKIAHDLRSVYTIWHLMSLVVAGILVGSWVGWLSKTAAVKNRFRWPQTRQTITSDGESSDEDYDIKHFGESSNEDYEIEHFGSYDEDDSGKVLRTGLLWKLERRFLTDMLTHEGEEFTGDDRFAFLENWDLRFFSLNLERGVLLMNYFSELREFVLVTFVIHSIGNSVFSIPLYEPERAKRSKYSKHQISNYDNYLEKIRDIGFDVDASSNDPDELHAFILSGMWQDESKNSASAESQMCDTPRRSSLRPGEARSRGRLFLSTTDDGNPADDQLARLCLASASSRETTKWYDQISKRLSGWGSEYRHAAETLIGEL